MLSGLRVKASSGLPVSPARREGLLGGLRVLAGSAIGQLATLATAATAVNAGAGQIVGMQSLDMQYAGYLVSGVGATPLASARLRASEQQGNYEIELTVESFLADLTYRSSGTIGPRGLVPQQYREHRKVAFRSAREKFANYVHTDDPTLQNTVSGDVLYVPVGTQDRLSLILQIIWMSRRDPSVLSDNAEHELPFARTNRVTASRWRVRGPERLSRQQDFENAGRSRESGYRISRVADSRESIDVSMWLSAASGHRPLVLEFAEQGRSLRFVHDSV